MINVAVSGFAGRMGSAVVDAVTAADDMQVTCGIDPHGSSKVFAVYETVEQAVHAGGFDVLVDFTQPSVVEGNLRVALAVGIDCVVGTTGLANDKLEELSALAPEGTCLFYAPNFTTGAVLMMQFAKAAAPFFPEAEVIEFHHCNKKDAPSGTAADHLRGPRRPSKRRAWQGNRDRRLRGSPWRVGGRRARALDPLYGLCGKPGSGVRFHGPDPYHPPRFVGSHFVYARRAAGHPKRRRPTGPYRRP